MHSFYAVMGGFVFETSTPTFGPHSRFALTGDGVLFLLEHAPELISDISETSILNRSRSDGLGKALLIVQLFYFCISCAARWAQSLPLTLLEVSTLAHAICAVATYLVWWKKPFDIADPTVISGLQVDEVAAYLLFISVNRRSRLAGVLAVSSDSECSYLRVSQAGVFDTGPSSEATVAVDGALQARDVRPHQIIRIDNFTFVVSSKEPDRVNSSFVYDKDSVPWYHRERGPGNTARLEERDLTRWRLAAGTMARFRGHRPDNETMYVTWRGGLQQSVFLERDTGWWPCTVPSVITVLYGSCHLLGWNAAFPTSVEHIMWRAGALVMIILGFLPGFLPLLLLSLIMLGLVRQPQVQSGFIVHFIVIIWIIILVAYPAIASFLVVESVRQLFYLPDDAFQLPKLSPYLPHFA